MPAQSISASVFVDRFQVTDPIDVTVKLSSGTKAGIGKATTLSGTEIPELTQGSVHINSLQQITGTINSTEDRGDGSHKVTLYDAARDLRQNSLTQSYDEALITDVLSDVFNAAAPGDIVLSEAEQQRVNTADGDGNGDYLVTESFTNIPCLRILERLCRSVNWYWYVDHTNTIQVVDSFVYEHATHYGHERFNVGIELTPPSGRTFLIHELQYVLDASPGKLSPPYKRVVVTGSMAGSDAPPEQQHLQSKDPVRAVATSDSYTQGDPSYVYRDEMLTTDENAQKAANAILEQLEAQQTGGWVKVVGHPLVRPHDVIQMPDHMGGEQYLVADVEHTVNSTDGYTTRIQCNGLMSTAEDRGLPTPYSSERVDELQEEIHTVPLDQR